MEITRLNDLDIGIFLVYMIIVLSIGFWVGRREKETVSDYFRAGNTLPWYAIGFSIVAAAISTEQFLGEVGTAYAKGMPVLNWEWGILPSVTILIWIFLPIYVRNGIVTMGEYLEKRYSPSARTAYALLLTASYAFINFALVLYSGAYALNAIFGIPMTIGIWILALTTGAYTIYGGLAAVAWTNLFQGPLLLAGGLLVFALGLSQVDGGVMAVMGSGQRAHMGAPYTHDTIPWTAFIVLALSTNTWYYCTNQSINQRCLAAKSEWHAKAGVTLAGFLQVFLAFAVAIPGMIAFAMHPNLADPNAAYPWLVTNIVPLGLQGLILAALLGAIMSTLSGLMNSSATMVTLDVYQRLKPQTSEKKLVLFGRIAAGAMMVFGCFWAPMVAKWELIFMYAQDLWALFAAPVVVVFVGGMLWKRATKEAAGACLLLIVPALIYVYIWKAVLKEALLPELMRPMVFGGVVLIFSIILFVTVSLLTKKPDQEKIDPLIWRPHMLRLPKEELAKGYPWYKHLSIWYAVVAAIFIGIYIRFW